MTGFARKVPYAEKISPAKAQRRKAAAAFFKGFLCAFAPWRENISLHLGPDATFAHSRPESLNQTTKARDDVGR
jgi:hypothetical protein